MIGFNHLGRLGRTGNQMFQYAALRGIAANVGVNYCIPYHQNIVDDGIGNKLKTELFDYLNMSSVEQLNIQLIDESRPIVQEGQFNYNKKLHTECKEWIFSDRKIL